MPELISAQCLDFLGGQDASLIPDRVADNALYQGINISVKRGAIRPRWGYEKKDIDYPQGGLFNRSNQFLSYKQIFQSGKFQTLAPYPTGDATRLLIVVAGHIFLYNVTLKTLIHIPISGGSTLNTRSARHTWTAAGDSIVIFDFPNYPVIVTGATARRADPFYMEVPVSTNGAFNQNRLFIANAGNEFTGGDPVGSLAPNVNPPLTFQEIMTPASAYYGQIFQLTTAANGEPITAMGFLQVSDTSTGIGPLLIGTEKSIYAYGTDKPRAQWEQGQFGAILVYDAGIVGPRAMANSNSDMFFMAADGHVRSLAMSRDEQKRWARVPISREVEPWLLNHDEALKRFAFVTYYNNKVFFSVNPYRVSAVDVNTNLPIADYAHAGMVVLELDNMSSFGEPSKPVWAGLWTGINPMDMVVMNDRAFAISKDPTAINGIWEVNPEISHDTSECNIRYVRSRVYTKEHDFQDPFSNKEVHSLDLNLDALQGDFQLDVSYKPSHSSRFLPWGTVKHKAPWRDCDTPCNGYLQGYAHHMIRDLTLGSPVEAPEECDPATQELYRVFRKLMLKITFTGKYWEVHEYRIKALPRVMTPQETRCEEFGVVALPEECNDDWCIGDFNICLAQQPMT
jgi:hypothetical protein